MVLLQMLIWDLQPRTIIELGSGPGASAAWLGDLLDIFGLPGRVYSFDLAPPDMRHPRVTFAATDLQRVTTDFPAELLAGLDHPLLLIEDAHVNLPAVLGLFDRYMQSGDYLVVEDSAGKREMLGRWLAQNNDRYLVDTRYVDFFGQNATSAQDSILVRI
jgi:cephalosporin hydroxylase